MLGVIPDLCISEKIASDSSKWWLWAYAAMMEFHETRSRWGISSNSWRAELKSPDIDRLVMILLRELVSGVMGLGWSMNFKEDARRDRRLMVR